MKLFHQVEIFKYNYTFGNSHNKMEVFRQVEIFKDKIFHPSGNIQIQLYLR